MPHSIDFRIYYEDTDSGGVVYYANYLKFAERARTEMLRELGISQSNLAAESGLYFVVKTANLDLLAPARLDDLINLSTEITNISAASIEMQQTISINSKKIAIIKVLIVLVNQNFKPTRIPKNIKQLF